MHEPGSAVDQRQQKIVPEYTLPHAKLDETLYGIPRGSGVIGPFSQLLKDQAGDVKGTVIGVYGELSSHVLSFLESLATRAPTRRPRARIPARPLARSTGSTGATSSSPRSVAGLASVYGHRAPSATGGGTAALTRRQSRRSGRQDCGVRATPSTRTSGWHAARKRSLPAPSSA